MLFSEGRARCDIAWLHVTIIYTTENFGINIIYYGFNFSQLLVIRWIYKVFTVDTACGLFSAIKLLCYLIWEYFFICILFCKNKLERNENIKHFNSLSVIIYISCFLYLDNITKGKLTLISNLIGEQNNCSKSASMVCRAFYNINDV